MEIIHISAQKYNNLVSIKNKMNSKKHLPETAAEEAVRPTISSPETTMCKIIQLFLTDNLSSYPETKARHTVTESADELTQ